VKPQQRKMRRCGFSSFWSPRELRVFTREVGDKERKWVPSIAAPFVKNRIASTTVVCVVGQMDGNRTLSAYRGCAGITVCT